MTRFLVLLSGVLVAASAASADAIVYLDFDGDPSTPNITVDHSVTSLADFTGSAFGSTANEASLESKIMALVQADFADFNISFVTTAPAMGTFYTMGIDDSAYTFDNGGNDNARLYGKTSPADMFGRVWAGSFALTSSNQPYGGSALSSPALSFTNSTVDQIAQALANTMAHEIGHFFGATHENSAAGYLMYSEVESIERSTNKYWTTANYNALASTLGLKDTNGGGTDPVVPEPGTVFTLGLGFVAGLGYLRRRRRKHAS